MSANQAQRTGWSLVLLILLAAPAVAGSGIIYNGVDVWKTPGDGTSWLDFAADPIPADFFCSGSAPFIGRIVWEGLPLLTSPPDALGGADTVIYRLDDAVFNDQGVALTRLRVEALSLVSTEPIQTSCGSYQVRAMVAGGEQPVTEMRILRDNKAGGRFEAPLEFIAKLNFIPVDRPGETLELERKAAFEPGGDFFWTIKPRKPNLLTLKGFVLVDTDGDEKADTFLPGTSNFFPYGKTAENPDKQLAIPCKSGCHTASGSCHCPEIVLN